MFRTLAEARASWATDRARSETLGIIMPGVSSYLPDAFKFDFEAAMDAQPALSTDPNSGIPAFLSTMIDPEVYKILFAPNQAAIIFGEKKKGDWLQTTAMFPQVEHSGEVSSYGDYNENGHAGANTNFPQRQQYLWQVIKEYGERELEMAGLARLNWVSEIDGAAADVMQKFMNTVYFFGVFGLQNYGLINDPNLAAALTPATKAAGGVKWINSSGQIVATANEVYADIQSLYINLVTNTAGLVNQKTKMVLALSPTSATALTATNSFNVNVEDLLKKNFPSIRVETGVQYGAQSTANPQGVAAGNLVQLIAEDIEGQDTGYCSFGEKQRGHPVIRGLSSYKQKLTAGAWGSIIRMPVAFSQMLGV